MENLVNRLKAFRNLALMIGLAALLGVAVPCGAQTEGAGKTAIQAAATPAPEPAVSSQEKDLTGMSLENLMGLNVQVTSSSKKAESLMDATSAIYVITSEDIRRSGFQHLADLFKMVPGMQDNQDNASEWAVSSRGFDAQYNNKMLVLIDGRPVYGPIRGGVLWRSEDVMLEDIDRIEVIRGPGGTLWGSGAVNGVINIITKDSKVSQGLYASDAAGSLVTEAEDFRYGGKAGDDLYYRVYGKATHHGALQNPATGGSDFDDWSDQRGGFRADLHLDQDQLTLQGDYQEGHFNYSTNVFNPSDFTTITDDNTHFDQNGNILGRWVRTFPDGSEGQLQAFYSQVHSQTNDGQLAVQSILEGDFQHRFNLNGWNEVTWGGDFRNMTDDYRTVNVFYFPAQQDQNTYGAFLQDKLQIAENLLYFTAGCKLENDYYTGDQYLPSGRILFTPDKSNSFWAAVSKAVREPTRFEENAYQFVGSSSSSPATYEALYSNPGLQPEQVVAYEVGYRTQLIPKTSVDLAGFFNHYDRLVENIDVFNAVPSPLGNGTLDDEGTFFNLGSGDLWGVEASVKVDFSEALRVALGYSYQNYDNNLLTATNSVIGVVPPQNMFNGRVYFDPVQPLEFTGAFYYDDSAFLYDPDPTARGTLQSFCRVDVGITWKPTDNLEASVWGQNLEGNHTETFASDRLFPTTVVPDVYGQLTARY